MESTQTVQEAAAPAALNGNDAPPAAQLQNHQVLTFTLAAETYGVDILRVQEIRCWTPVTHIPQAPRHVLGVLNLRGSIVPIVDLRMRLELEKAEYNGLTVIIVLSVEGSTGRRDFGVVVDGVSDVIELNAAALSAPPDLGISRTTEYIRSIAKSGDHLVMLLDIDRLIGSDMGH